MGGGEGAWFEQRPRTQGQKADTIQAEEERAKVVHQQVEQRCELVSLPGSVLSPPVRSELLCHSCYSKPFEEGQTVGPPDPDSSHPDNSFVIIWSL